MPLLSTGLDSLCFAVIVARLEERFGIDPFAIADEVAFPVTVGFFSRFMSTLLCDKPHGPLSRTCCRCVNVLVAHRTGDPKRQ